MPLLLGGAVARAQGRCIVVTAILATVLVIGLVFMVLLIAAQRAFNDLLARAELLSGVQFSGLWPSRIVQALEAVLDRLTSQEHRLHLKHSVTGLPTRELLAARMATDATGTLALLSCKDYDRLCVFDPQLAERFLLGIAERIALMLPAARFVAQVDRSHLAVWIGPEVDAAEAHTEIDALAYALGSRLIEGEREILPEIVLRKARFDARQASPQSVISQTLSTFSLAAVSDTQASVATINLSAHARERYLVEQDLRQAIARNQLRLQYQPLIDAVRGRVCGAEALIRWDHPERGLMPPSRFIPIAETAGLSQEIGLWVLNRAARDTRSWQLAGLTGVRVAVNVSGHQLETDDLALLIARTLGRHGLEANALEVELTESVALADDVRARVLCDALRRLGVHIAIDDFGTGYSSLSALAALPFDKIKIDRAFVRDVDTRRDSQAICSSLFALGRGLGITLLAEGVETAAEYEWLHRHGCQYFQGYHFARPLQSDRFLEFARDPQALAVRLTASDTALQQRLRA